MSEFNDNFNNGENMQTDSPVYTVEPDTVEPQNGFSGAELVSGVETAKKKPIFLIIAIIAAVLVAGSVSAYFFIPYVKNNVKMLMNSPEEYYLWVEEQNMDKVADYISEAYGKALKTASGQNEQEVEFKVDIDPENVGALIEDKTNSPLSESGITLPSSVSVKAGTKVSKGSTKGAVQVNANDEALATMNMYVEDGTYYYQVPELSSSYISMDFKALMDEMMSSGDIDEINSMLGEGFMEAYMDTLTEMLSDPSSIEDILSEEELNEFITKYTKIIFENIEDVELEKGVKCKVNGEKAEFNKLSANIDQGTLYSICKDALKEAKKDKTIIKIIEKFGLSKSTYTDAVEELLDQLGTIEVRGGETMCIMNVYVNSSGKICGRDIEIPDEDDVTISFMTAEKGSDSYLDFEVIVDKEGVKITGESNKKSGKESGNIKVEIIDHSSSFEVPVSFKDFKVVNEDKGYCEGNFKIDLTEILNSDTSVITFDLDSDGKGQSIKTDITFDDVDYGTLTLSTKEKVSIDIPSFDSSEKVYKLTKDGSEIKEYVSEVSETLPTFLDNISAQFGLKGIGNLFGSAISSGSDNLFGSDSGYYDDDYDDYDDYDYYDSSSSNDAKYDLSKVNVEVSGQSIPLPAKIVGILDLVKVNDTTVSANDFASYYSEDYCFGVDISNKTNSSAAPADCTVTGIYSASGSSIPVSFDGFTIDSSISDIASKYGASLSDPSSGYITIYDSKSNLNNMTFFYYNGKVSSMSIRFYE